VRKDNVTTWATLALILGVAGLMPGLAAVLFLPALVLAITAVVLAWKRPERYAGRKRALFALVLALAGSALFVAEIRWFLSWKIDQAEAQRWAITEERMGRIAFGLEAYREQRGGYPAAAGVRDLCRELVPRYMEECTQMDGWGRMIQVRSRRGEARIWVLPLGENPVPREIRMGAAEEDPRRDNPATGAATTPEGDGRPGNGTFPGSDTPPGTGDSAAYPLDGVVEPHAGVLL